MPYQKERYINLPCRANGCYTMLLKNIFAGLCAVLFGTAFNAVNAQESKDDYEHFTVNNGLPTQTTYNIFQDRAGFLWIATDAGVSCYDGKNFQNYTTEDGLGDNEILNLFQDKQGRIWFMPFSNKLSYYSNGRFYNEDNDTFLRRLGPLTHMNYPIEDTSGNIYTQARGNPGMVIKIGADKHVTTLDLVPLIGTADVVSVLYRSPDQSKVYGVTGKGRLILLSGKTPVEIKSGGDYYFGHEPIDWFPNFKKPELLLYVNSKGIFALSDTVAKLLMPAQRITQLTHIFSILLDKYQNIWISDFKENTLFFQYLNGSFAAGIPVLKGIFTFMAFDNEDNIWFCTGNQGMYKTTYTKLVDNSLLYFNPKLLQQNILCTFADSEGTLWVGYGNGYITQISGTFIKHHNLNFGSRTYNRVLQIKGDRDGDIWCTTDETCLILKKTSAKTFSKPYHSQLASTKGIAFDQAGDAFVTMPMSQARVRKKGMRVDNHYFGNVISERTYSSFFDAQNRWYISTLSGLKIIEGNKVLNLALNDSRLKTRIQYFAENSDGTVFIATYSDGVMALRNNKVAARITRTEGLAGVICRRIYSKHDTLFIASNGGITIALFQDNKFRVLQNLGLLDGLPSIDVNDLAFIGNILYAATSEGMAALTLFTGKQLFVAPPTLTLADFMVNETSVVPDSPLVFPYAQQRVRIKYIAAVMEKPEMVSYRYRFLGRNKEWHVTTANELEFNDLPHGEFNLEIQAKKYNSTWSAPRQIAFTITPPFSSTWWFRIVVVLSSAYCLYSLVRLILTKRFRQQLAALKQKEAIEKERNRIAADIHDDMGAELTNIVIQARVLKKSAANIKPVSDIIDKLERSSNEAINKMNEVIWTLNKANDTLHNLAAYLRNYITRLLEENELDSLLTFDDSVYSEHFIKADLSRNIFLIIKETLHNIIKHSSAKRVEVIVLLKKDSNLFFEIRDNGNGFDTLKTSAGNGIQNIKKRVLLINGKVNIYSKPGGGCIINVMVPL